MMPRLRRVRGGRSLGWEAKDTQWKEGHRPRHLSRVTGEDSGEEPGSEAEK